MFFFIKRAITWNCLTYRKNKDLPLRTTTGNTTGNTITYNNKKYNRKYP